MSDIERKKSYVLDLYPGRGWKKKVAKMSDAQVVAIFLREQSKANETKSKETSRDNGDIPF